MSLVHEIIEDLSRRKKSVACLGKQGLRNYLSDLGFTDTEGKTPGHRVFTHEMLSRQADFISFSIDCGHKPKREMKFQYVVKTIKILQKYDQHLNIY